MDPNYFDIALANALGDYIEVAGSPGCTFSAAARRSFALRAVDAYSVFNPITRPWGQGNLYEYNPLPVASTVAYAMGGPWIPGDQVVLSPNLSNQETLTVQSVQPVSFWSLTQPRRQAAILNMPLTEITFTTPTTFQHYPNTIIEKVYPGLALIANVGTYTTSNDFKQLDPNTFDIAIGRKPTAKRQPGYWDNSLELEAAYSGLSWADEQDYSVGWQNGGYAFGYSPNAYLTDGVGPAASGWPCQEQIIRVIRSEPQTLLFLPAPTQAGNLVFLYQSNHTISSVPSADIDILVSYGEYAGWLSMASHVQHSPDVRIGEYQLRASLNAAQYRNLAADALKRFYDATRNRPLFVLG